jgi:hypothetical protein
MATTTTQKPNAISDALKKAILEKVHADPKIQDLLNELTGIVLGAAEDLRGTYEDADFHDGFHCDVHNEIYEGVENAVHLVVDNWNAMDEI